MSTAAALRSKDTKQVSAYDRLRLLPAVFRATQAAFQFDWDSKTTSHYLWLWKQRNLIEGLGGKSDVFVNTLLHPDVNWEEALLMATPSAVVIGLESLLRAGWITQIPRPPHIAIAPVDTLYKLHPRELTEDEKRAWHQRVVRDDLSDQEPPKPPGHFLLERRTMEWYAAVRRHGILPTGSPRSAPTLHPSWALADLLVTKGWAKAGITPSDVDWDAPSDKDRAQWKRAASALNVRPELIAVDDDAVEALSPAM